MDIGIFNIENINIEKEYWSILNFWKKDPLSFSQC